MLDSGRATLVQHKLVPDAIGRLALTSFPAHFLPLVAMQVRKGDVPLEAAVEQREVERVGIRKCRPVDFAAADAKDGQRKVGQAKRLLERRCNLRALR